MSALPSTPTGLAYVPEQQVADLQLYPAVRPLPERRKHPGRYGL